MKIFASWSGQDSRDAAELMREWLPNVIQEVDVWVSSQDISKGEKWSDSLWASLADHQFGLLFITRMNHSAPWILFEAGALAKTVKSFVIPILCRVDRIDVSNSPLNQFQNAVFEKEDMYKVVEAIGRACERPMPPDRLRSTFEKWWPDLIEGYNEISFKEKAEPKQTGAKADAERLDKIEGALEAVMGTLHQIRRDVASNRKYAQSVHSTKGFTLKEYNEWARDHARKIDMPRGSTMRDFSSDVTERDDGPNYAAAPEGE